MIQAYWMASANRTLHHNLIKSLSQNLRIRYEFLPIFWNPYQSGNSAYIKHSDWYLELLFPFDHRWMLCDAKFILIFCCILKIWNAIKDEIKHEEYYAINLFLLHYLSFYKCMMWNDNSRYVWKGSDLYLLILQHLSCLLLYRLWVSKHCTMEKLVELPI